MLCTCAPYLSFAMAAAMPPSTALSAPAASVSLKGHGKYGVPVLEVVNVVSAMSCRHSKGIWLLASWRSFWRACCVSLRIE